MDDPSTPRRRGRAGGFRPFARTLDDFRDPERSALSKAGIAFSLAFLVFATALAAFMVYALLLIPTAPSAAELQRYTAIHPSVVLAADGTEITQFERRNQVRVSLADVSPAFIDALLVVEDRRFYEHRGVDWRRVAGAGLRTLGGTTEGGSTLTQQLARNLFPDEIGRRLTIRRKLRETITAFRIERTHSKEQILEAYVNTVPFLYNAFGVEMAARTYYDTSASALDAAQAATLVGMLRGTSYYNPVRYPERSKSRRNLVLRMMADAGALERAEADRLRATDLDLEFERQDQTPSPHPHFTRYVRSWAAEWADRHGYDIYADGLVIHTTLDPELQAAAEEAVRTRGAQLDEAAQREWAGGDRPFGGFWARNPESERRALRRSGYVRAAVERGLSEDAALDSLRADPAARDSVLRAASRVESGFVAIEPGTGYVRAYVGSRDFSVTPFDHVRQARRQPGSTFKPFVYAAALSQGFMPGDTFVDERTTIQVDSRRTWQPTNAGNTYTGAEMTLTEGLAYSVNTVTAKLMMEVGPGRVASLARDAGIRESSLEAVPALALGSSEVTLLELVTAYATLAHSGRYAAPLPVTRIESRTGRVLAEFGPRTEQAVSAQAAQVLVHMLRGAIDRGTGRRIRGEFGITADVAGKTGTSQHGADGWFVLMHPRLVAGAWVGFPEPSVTWRTSTYGQGSRNALPIVGSFFREAQSVLPAATFDTPQRYREEGSIWQRARRWWDGRGGEPDWDDEALYRSAYTDAPDWEYGTSPVPPDHDLPDLPDAPEIDLPEDFRPPPTDTPRPGVADRPDPSGHADEAAGTPEPAGRTAVQRLLDRTGEQLEGVNDDG